MLGQGLGSGIRQLLLVMFLCVPPLLHLHPCFDLSIRGVAAGSELCLGHVGAMFSWQCTGFHGTSVVWGGASVFAGWSLSSGT